MIEKIVENTVLKSQNEVILVEKREVVNMTINSTGQYVSAVAGENINGHKVIFIKDNKAYMASNDNLECLNAIVGLSVNAAIVGDIVKVQTIGELEGFEFTKNGNKYLGLNGDLTETISGSFMCVVGTAISNTKLLINNQLLTIKRA